MGTLEADLRAALRGTVRCDELSRALYAVDASIYQIQPLGMVAPADEGDVLTTLRLARQHGVPLISRGGATSLAGQTVGAGLHLDTTPALNRLRELNLDQRSVRVQPGIVLADLNRTLADHGLHFAPDVSPSNRATIGGMIGNNSCGMYSLVHGKTIDHVQRLKVALSDGTLIDARPLTPAEYAAKLQQPGREGEIYRGLRDLLAANRAEIAARFPRLLRRVGGYNLDRLAQAAVPNLVDLLVGSEGTLAVTLEASLKLVPLPRARGMCVLHFPDLLAAVDAVVPVLEAQPAAVELMDDLLLQLTARSPEYGPLLRQFVHGAPAALLLVELWADDEQTLRERLAAFAQSMAAQGVAASATIAASAAELAPITAVRKAGQPLLMAYAPDLKPQTCVEDSAVPPERLGAYVRRFKAILDQHATMASFYGHASVGLLHVRPLLNLNDPADVRKLRVLSEAICELVLEFNGALSGEHGDGLLRSEFNERIFGPQIYAAFRQVKALFDPLNLLNPGKITAAPPLDLNLRPAPHSAPLTTYRFAATGGIAGAVELCNGNGLCRKSSGGTMCPSYRATRSEEHSTRGRANALRAVFNGTLPSAALTGARLHAALDLCLECKACTAECPSGVNMTRLKSEVLHQHHQAHGVPLRSRFFAAGRQLNQLGAAMAPLANWLLRAPGAGWLRRYTLGLAPQRPMPLFARHTFFDWWRTARPPASAGALGSVVLFPDTWTSYSEPQIPQATVQLLWAAGYAVLLPARALCCGRPALSKGLLDVAVRQAQAQLEWLAPYALAGLPIIGLEPSCMLSFRDEYPDLLTDVRVAALAEQCLTFEEFVARESAAGRWRLSPLPLSAPVLAHDHCHARALAHPQALAATLRTLTMPGLTLLDAGCCGMAGSFGYEHEHYALSLEVGADVFAAVHAQPAAQLVAVGTSCRHQIAHATGRTPVHPAELLWQQVCAAAS